MEKIYYFGVSFDFQHKIMKHDIDIAELAVAATVALDSTGNPVNAGVSAIDFESRGSYQVVTLQITSPVDFTAMLDWSTEMVSDVVPDILEDVICDHCILTDGSPAITHATLTLSVDYAEDPFVHPNDVASVINTNLKSLALLATNEGLLTAGTDMEVEDYKSFVNIRQPAATECLQFLDLLYSDATVVIDGTFFRNVEPQIEKHEVAWLAADNTEVVSIDDGLIEFNVGDIKQARKDSNGVWHLADSEVMFYQISLIV